MHVISELVRGVSTESTNYCGVVLSVALTVLRVLRIVL